MTDGDTQDGSTQAPSLNWRELLEARRFGVARHAYLLELATAPDTPAGDEQTRSALSALADVEDLVRERSYAKAKTRIERMEVRGPLAPWEAIMADLDALAVTAKALDKREPEAALAGLEPLAASWLLAEVITQRGTAQIYLGELDQAQESFASALEIDPQHYRALTNLGNVALEESRVDDAIEFYERAIKLNDQFANAHHNLGVAYRRKGQLSKSVRSLRKAQRVAQRQETTQARESISQWSGARGSKAIKWVIYAVIGGVLIWFLRSQGYI
jgi:tetratricopeptide (TPR) repeat protein